MAKVKLDANAAIAFLYVAKGAPIEKELHAHKHQQRFEHCVTVRINFSSILVFVLAFISVYRSY